MLSEKVAAARRCPLTGMLICIPCRQEKEYEENTGYKVAPHMCMNKALVLRYKEISFPIVSCSELVEIILKSRKERMR